MPLRMVRYPLSNHCACQAYQDSAADDPVTVGQSDEGSMEQVLGSGLLLL